MEFFSHLPILTSFALTLILTLVLPNLMERLHLPRPVGYILAGVLLGPNVLSVLNPDGKVVSFFAELGKLLLMFFAGFEVNFTQFQRARNKAATFGFLTFACPFIFAIGIAAAVGYSANACAVVGAILASHTLLGLPIVKDKGLMGLEATVVTVGATLFTDMLSILVLAICVPIHVQGFEPVGVMKTIAWLVIYVPAVLFGLSWLVERLLNTFGTSRVSSALIMLVTMAVSAQVAEWIGMEGIIGAFLAGVSLKRAFGELDHDESLEVMSQALFIPVFFIAAGFLVDFKVFFNTLSHHSLLVLGVLVALFGGKWLAAEAAGRWLGYGHSERELMFALTIPQVAATLAVALVAYATVNASGQRLIDQAMLNATVVLVIASSLLGLILTERAARLVKQKQAEAPLRSAGFADAPPGAE
ncbi:cation:proton antiporter [Bradyrhizobium japonicum]|uniref:cation:proton antiporter n=1 Tax=Bradyrhizobium japonicum TaxID=375 RepID=UPI000414092B|nr:cation:proton antiporter [Bradyrhizobium japonicum]MCS3896713.1 Kef-type K+ transport system membrane component KefB [Bradyrhizobium japonicum USDA 38]MCS3949228.1 Kef-type K+ transport system membrane component KefB [Bradyrhizobium japonicum]MCW2218088.1 Kef-type K+ transport system membrane component KefB [Bradyrhizobium japonicum]MCW2342701.1 Kef-type K+ transport system membrane component KefB [Bradyrhizobium japonicum]UQD76731.1 cation:proton antiporter [Bradyrhizobium japonicum]